MFCITLWGAPDKRLGSRSGEKRDLWETTKFWGLPLFARAIMYYTLFTELKKFHFPTYLFSLITSEKPTKMFGIWKRLFLDE